MGRFRKCLKAVWHQRLRLQVGECSPEAEHYRANAIATFGGKKGHALERLVKLQTYLNGDWRDRESVCVYIATAPEDAATEARLRNKIINEVTWVLAGARPRLFPRHRWKGAAESLDDLGLIEIARGLLTAAFKDFAATFNTSRNAQGASASSSTAATQLADPLPALQDLDPSGGRVDVGCGVLPVDSDIVEAEGGGTSGVSAGGTAQWQQESVATRRAALKFLEGPEHRALSDMLSLRLQLEPLSSLLNHQMRMAADDWEAEQRRQEVGRSRRDGDQDLPTERRLYPLTVAASGVLEAAYFKRLRLLLDKPELWKLTPPSAMTE